MIRWDDIWQKPKCLMKKINPAPIPPIGNGGPCQDQNINVMNIRNLGVIRPSERSKPKGIHLYTQMI